jgi:hypothetical protein
MQPPEIGSCNDGLTICPVCGKRFRRVGRQRFCDGACRQEAWRRRHPSPLPMVPPRSPRTSTVYECPACATRYLGDQYCPDCRSFCRRIGQGGLCPACEEPVAIADLLPNTTHTEVITRH